MENDREESYSNSISYFSTIFKVNRGLIPILHLNIFTIPYKNIFVVTYSG